jgi:hypothetical protein
MLYNTGTGTRADPEKETEGARCASRALRGFVICVHSRAHVFVTLLGAGQTSKTGDLTYPGGSFVYSLRGLARLVRTWELPWGNTF